MLILYGIFILYIWGKMEKRNDTKIINLLCTDNIIKIWFAYNVDKYFLFIILFLNSIFLAYMILIIIRKQYKKVINLYLIINICMLIFTSIYLKSWIFIVMPLLGIFMVSIIIVAYVVYILKDIDLSHP